MLPAFSEDFKTMIKADSRNYRKHNERNKQLINKSLKECGAGRSIVIDNEENIIAGNGIYEQAQKLGIKTKIIETDGSELVVVKRTDLATNDDKRKQLAVMDNSTSDSSEFDLELLQTDFDLSQLSDWGIDNIKDVISKYSRKITLPIYEPKGDCPSLEQLIDTSRADKLIEKINELEIDEKIKKFLLISATRLYEFRYDLIAEYYCHQDKKTKSIMEDLALVLVDFKKAIEQGYIELNDFIENCFLEDMNLNE